MILAAVLMFAFAAREASADVTCSLSVNPWPVVGVGQFFSYGIDIVNPFAFGPWPPTTLVFFGTKNGVTDTPPGGEQAPFGILCAGHSDLTGYQNPGGISGTYVRYAVIYANGQFYCATNPVTVVLQ
jgi:hypothetical protein